MILQNATAGLLLQTMLYLSNSSKQVVDPLDNIQTAPNGKWKEHHKNLNIGNILFGFNEFELTLKFVEKVEYPRLFQKLVSNFTE